MTRLVTVAAVVVVVAILMCAYAACVLAGRITRQEERRERTGGDA